MKEKQTSLSIINPLPKKQEQTDKMQNCWMQKCVWSAYLNANEIMLPLQPFYSLCIKLPAKQIKNIYIYIY